MNSISAIAHRSGVGRALTIPISLNVSALTGLMKELKKLSRAFDDLAAHTLIVARPFDEVLRLESGSKLEEVQTVIYDLSSERCPVVILSGPTLKLHFDASVEVVTHFSADEPLCNWCGCIDGPCGHCCSLMTSSTESAVQ